MCEELLLTVGQAAKRLALGRSMLYLMLQRQELRSIKIGGARRILASDLLEFVERQRAAADEE